MINYKTLILMTTFTILFLYFNDNSITSTPEQILSTNLDLEANLFKTAETINYTSFYSSSNDITLKATVSNLLHGLIYNVIIVVNTAIPIVVHVSAGSYAAIIVKLFLFYILILLLFWLPQVAKAIISVYFFFKEKKKFKEKIWH